MPLAFDLPLGAAADVVELEYVSALHQTDVINGVRKDGSIQGKSTGEDCCLSLFSKVF